MMAKLLLIEDEQILRENTSELLEVYGFECITASHGREGIEKAIAEKPDLVICDIMLPYFNGFQIKEQLNREAHLSLIPFIFLSAKAERYDLRQGMDLGAADFITKPFKISELVNSIKSRLIHSKNMQSVVHEKVIDSIKDFIQLSKHECNTPLHGIINLSGILNAGHANQPEFFNKALKAINTSGKRLYKTLNNLIDLVRLRHYTEIPEQEHTSTDITSILERIVSERCDHYRFKGAIKTRYDDFNSVQILQEDLEIIIFEVIDNMFKFSSPRCVNIVLDTNRDKSEKLMILTVSNSIASPVNFTKSEIGPFKQHNRSQSNQQGSGLGLFLIQTIVEKYLGTLEIDLTGFKLFRIILTIPLT